MSVSAAAERFVAGHLEEHLDQLAELLAGGDTPA
jgi:demethoxyubiquinone hydroxylase (CLK1/Coq7/Cat5 family)